MKNRILQILAALLIVCSSSSAQTLILVDSLKIPTPKAVSIDQSSNFYIADHKGSLRKYSLKGKLIAEFSPQKVGSISLIEAWNPLRPFIFYENFQEYLFLDRFLTTSNRFSTQPITDYAGLVTTSADNNLWIIDLADFGLKKYNNTYGEFSIRTSFDLLLDRDNYDIAFIREYQNMVFISDRYSGILVFDNLGNYLKTLPYTGIDYFNFNGANIYFLRKNELIKLNIYTLKEEIILLRGAPLFALISNDTLLTFGKKSLKISRITN